MQWSPTFWIYGTSYLIADTITDQTLNPSSSMPNTTSNPAVVNCDTGPFGIIMVIASKVSKIDGKVASIVCLVFRYRNVVNIYFYMQGNGSVM